jgi:peptidoglycan/LPS O-acetylase OafA/YrhL
MKRIPSLDGLRAISISLVVAGHWVELHYKSDVAGAFANLGVRIFFVISGYLITTLLLEERARRATIRLRDFYVRRAYRILPAAMLYMFPVFAIFRHELRWYHAAAAALYLTNFDYAHPWFVGHLWSFSVEEQFYFLWPGVLKKWYRHRVAILVGVIVFAPVYRVACHLLGWHGRADETFPAVADILAFGCLLGILAPRLRGIKKGGGTLGGSAYFGSNVRWHFAFSRQRLAVICAVACDACMHRRFHPACCAVALSDFELGAGGVVGEDQLQPVFVAAVVRVRDPCQAVVFRVCGRGVGQRVLLLGGAACAAIAGPQREPRC